MRVVDPLRQFQCGLGSACQIDPHQLAAQIVAAFHQQRLAIAGEAQRGLVPRNRLQPFPLFRGKIVEPRLRPAGLRIGGDGEPLGIGADVGDSVDRAVLAQHPRCFPGGGINLPDFGRGVVHFDAIGVDGLASIGPDARRPFVIGVGLCGEHAQRPVRCDHGEVGLRFAAQLHRQRHHPAFAPRDQRPFADIGRGRDLLHRAAAGGDAVEIVIFVPAAVLHEIEPLAIARWRKAALGIVGLGHLQRPAAASVGAPDIVASGQVGDDEDMLAVRAPGGAADAARIADILQRHLARFGVGRRRQCCRIRDRPVRCHDLGRQRRAAQQHGDSDGDAHGNSPLWARIYHHCAALPARKDDQITARA